MEFIGEGEERGRPKDRPEQAAGRRPDAGLAREGPAGQSGGNLIRTYDGDWVKLPAKNNETGPGDGAGKGGIAAGARAQVPEVAAFTNRAGRGEGLR